MNLNPRTRALTARLATLAVSFSLFAAPALADPCGMVPPVAFTGKGDPIERVGAQKTYVFFKDGVETLVLRPGFKGKVDEFGMLIPFPSVPAIRKVDDDIFAHVAAAVDPPEVSVYVRRYDMDDAAGAAPRPSKSSAAPGLALKRQEVKVLKREAVGMYDVAVLAAGSAQALKRWMDSHGFAYPSGMDKTTEEYVTIGWVFVAVKTQVGDKSGVNPRPGMKKASAKLTAGEGFDGHVQAMGFRFETKDLVVPMRLSAFNKGQLRNIVYLLTDGPRRIDNIPSRYVVRQLTGQELFENVTELLPVRVIGGTWDDLDAGQIQNLKHQRNPEPHNGLAKRLFAGDLLAVAKKRLSNPFEEAEKHLLVISERLGMRGKALDALHAQVLQEQEGDGQATALAGLKNMTLTVVDGDFPRDVLARENLSFSHHVMPAERNNPKAYDARQMGPGAQLPGKVYRRGASNEVHDGARKAVPAALPLLLLGLLIPLAFVARRRGRAALMAVLLAVGGATLATPDALAGDRGQQDQIASLIEDLGVAKRAERASLQLKQVGSTAVDSLLDAVVDGRSPVQRGWAVLTLQAIGGERVDAELKKLHDDSGLPGLVRAWAAAARIQTMSSLADLAPLAAIAAQLPAIQRPLTKRVLALAGTVRGWKGLDQLLDLATRFPHLNQALQPAAQQMGPAAMIGVMRKSTNGNVRRLAAGYVGAFASQDASVARQVVRAYRFRPGAQVTPWEGGPLFVPALNWTREDARDLAGALIRWHLWADLNGKADIKKQIHNNLRSLQLARAAGFRGPGWQEVDTLRWLQIWGKATSRSEIGRILREQGVRWRSRYRQVLTRI